MNRSLLLNGPSTWRRVIRVLMAAWLGGCFCFAHAQTTSRQRVAAFAKLPDWSGLWEWDVFADLADGQQLSPEGQRRAQLYFAAARPSFKPAWQAKYEEAKKALDAAIAADPSHPPATRQPCAAPPFPATTRPGIYEWRVTPEEATLISSLGSVRHIYTDGRSHPPKDELWPTKMGDSIGRWEGDTLAVDTVSTKPQINLIERGFYEMVMPMSDQLHFTERIRLANHNEMQIQFTTEDPVALSKPIQVTLTYLRVTDTNRMIDEFDCDPATDRNPVVNGRFTTVVQ
jgi:hypothetical protein